jgi:hypothetical protein
VPLILAVGEKNEGPRSSSIDQLYRRSYTRTFFVETSSPTVGSAAVRTASGIPQPGTYYTNGLNPSATEYEYDQGSFVQSVEASMDSGTGGLQWTVTVTYGPYDTASFGADPTLWPLRVSFGGESTERVIYFDRNGDAILNSAYDRFGDPITVPDHLRTMTITRNELVRTYNPELASTYSDTVNDATWNGFAAGRCLMGIISTGEPQFDSTNRVYYYTVTYPVRIERPGRTWVKELLDQGFNVLDSSSPPKQIPYTNGGQPASDPVALDGSGGKLPTNGTPVSLTFDVYDEADWSGLNINLSTRLGA